MPRLFRPAETGENLAGLSTLKRMLDYAITEAQECNMPDLADLLRMAREELARSRQLQ